MQQNASFPRNSAPDLRRWVILVSCRPPLPPELCIFADPLKKTSHAVLFENTTNPHVLLPFYKLSHRACHTNYHKLTVQPPKVVWKCGDFTIFISKCASRHSGVHFSTVQLPKVLQTWSVLRMFTSNCKHVHLFNISTSKSAANPQCF